MSAPGPMHARVRERAELAVLYAEDGAYFAAARVLKQIAEETRAHAERVLAANMELAEAQS